MLRLSSHPTRRAGVRFENSSSGRAMWARAGNGWKRYIAGLSAASSTCSAGLDGVVRTPFQDLVDQAVGHRVGGALEIVAFGVPGDGFQRLAGVLGHDLVQAGAHGQDL